MTIRLSWSPLVLGLILAPPAAAQEPRNCCSAEVLAAGLQVAERYRVTALDHRRFTHAEFWTAVAPALESTALRVSDVGRSLQGRAIRAVTFGDGPTTVLLWSQMHGDESTATMALADIVRFLAEATTAPLRERLRRALTIVFVPMLNPDGAERFQRQNAAGIDVNRDARRLATPEARALSALRDSLEPEFGFNLHDQNARTRAGEGGLQAAIALLPPAYDSARSYDEIRSRARHVAAVVATLLGHEIPGRIARYDDTFGPRAFGDTFQRRGTSTVLIESGALPGDPAKQRLRALNGAAILGALDAIGTGRYLQADPGAYEELPGNTAGAHDLLVLGGLLVLPGAAPFRADVAIDYGDPVARLDGRVAEVGDLQESVAIDTVDATGLFLFPADSVLTREGDAVWLRVGTPAVFDGRRGPRAGSELVRRIGGGNE
jgi:hypothetical protein